MEKKFIKYKPEQVNPAKLYQTATGNMFDANDLQDGTLVVGCTREGQFLAMGYLRGMARDNATGKVLYEIENAIEGNEFITCVYAPYRVNVCELPWFAATSPNFTHPLVGSIVKCNGELAVIYDGSKAVVVNVNSIHRLTPYFKETK